MAFFAVDSVVAGFASSSPTTAGKCTSTRAGRSRRLGLDAWLRSSMPARPSSYADQHAPAAAELCCSVRKAWASPLASSVIPAGRVQGWKRKAATFKRRIRRCGLRWRKAASERQRAGCLTSTARLRRCRVAFRPGRERKQQRPAAGCTAGRLDDTWHRAGVRPDAGPAA